MFDGDRLKALRLSYGLTLQKVAEDLSMNKVDISRYERGLVQPRPDRIKDFAYYFRVDFVSFIKPLPSKNPKEVFSKEESRMVTMFATLNFYQQVRLVGYFDGLIASGDTEAAVAAADLNEAAATVQRVSVKRANKP